MKPMNDKVLSILRKQIDHTHPPDRERLLADRKINRSRSRAIYSQEVTGDRLRISCVQGNDVLIYKFLLDDQGDDGEVVVRIDPDQFLSGLGAASKGKRVHISSKSGDSHEGVIVSRRDFWARGYTVDGIRIKSPEVLMGQLTSFDKLLLDSFSVIENLEARRRGERDVELGITEIAILNAVSKNPELLTRFSPRAFEVFCGFLLADLGLNNVRVSRFSQDNGYDIFAIACEGNRSYAIVVEVKRYTKSTVGLAIVDRLNGVRSREGAARGVLLTTSSISATAKRLYQYGHSKIALIDRDALFDILATRGSQWKVSPGGLWSLPRRRQHSE